MRLWSTKLRYFGILLTAFSIRLWLSLFPVDILKLFSNKNVGSPKVGLHLSQYFDSKWCQDEIQIALRFSHYVKCHRCQHTFFSFLRIWMVFWKSPFAYFLFKVIFRRNCASDIWQHFIPFRILILKKCKRQKRYLKWDRVKFKSLGRC